MFSPLLSPLPPQTHPNHGGVAGILMKIYSKIGQLAESEDGSYKGIHMPMNDGKTESKGFAFVEFVDRKVILERCHAYAHMRMKIHTYAHTYVFFLVAAFVPTDPIEAQLLLDDCGICHFFSICLLLCRGYLMNEAHHMASAVGKKMIYSAGV